MTPSVGQLLVAVVVLVSGAALLRPRGGARRLRSVRRRGATGPAARVLRPVGRWLGRSGSRGDAGVGARGRDDDGGPLEAVVALLDRLSALSRAGLAPHQVWEQLAATPGPVRPVCAYVAESVGAGGSVGLALHHAASLLPPRPRRADVVDPADVLRWLAVALTVSERTGAPAAEGLDRLAAAVRAETAAADDRAAALAGPQATAQVLGWLPAAGVLLGALVGANPVRTLLLTGPGRVCLLLGGGLWLAGRWWSAALVRTAARAGG